MSSHVRSGEPQRSCAYIHDQTSRGLLNSPLRCVHDLDESTPQACDLYLSPFGIVLYTVDRARRDDQKAWVLKYLASRTDPFLMQEIHASSHGYLPTVAHLHCEWGILAGHNVIGFRTFHEVRSLRNRLWFIH